MNTKTIKTTLAAALFSSCSYILQAQLTLSGKVITTEKTAIPFSAIGIMNTYLATQANAQGQFEFKNLKAGTYIVFTKCVGYKTKTDTIVLTENKTFDIILNQDNKSLDEIAINATRVNQNSAFAHSNLTSEEIKKQNVGQDLPYALNSMPSVVINSDAGNGVGYTGMRIRGTDGTRINVTINGVPVNDAESQGTFFVNMPDFLSSTNSIQVQRGVGTSANGAGAFGASINMQTNQLNEKPYAEINNSIGSFNTTKNTISAGTGLINNHFTFDARGSKISSDGYIDRASSKLSSYYLAAGYYGKNTTLKAIAFIGQEKTYQAWNYVLQDSIKNGNRTYNSCGQYTSANGEIKYYNNETDNYKQDNYQLHFIHSFGSKLTANITGHYTKGKGYYEQYKQGQNLLDYNMPNVITAKKDTITTTDLIRQRWLDNDFIGAIGNLNYKSNNKLNFTLGGGYNNYIGRHFGDVIWAQYSDVNNYKPRYYENQAHKTDGNVYLKTTYNPITKLTCYVDLQYRRVNYNFYGFGLNSLEKKQVTTNFDFFNPKLGVNYLIAKNTSIYASYSIANKEPNRNDFLTISRPKSEQLNDFEIGATHRLKNVSFGLNVYDMEYKNQLVLNGQINDVGEPKRVNVDNSYRRGMEFELNANITKYFTFNGNVTLSQNKIKSYDHYIDSYIYINDNRDSIAPQEKVNYSNTDISFSPNMIAAANFIFKPIKNFEIGLLNKYIGKQYLDNTSNNERSINTYFVTDLRINYSLYTKLIKEINLVAVIYNITNRLYETNGYNYSYFYTYGGTKEFFSSNYLAPSAPTHFMIGLNLKF